MDKRNRITNPLKEYHSKWCYLRNKLIIHLIQIFGQPKTRQKIGSQAANATTKSLAAAGNFAADIGSQALSLGKKYASQLMMGAFIPALRWIRRNAMTSVGIVVDVVTAMIPITSGANKLVWAMIVILDLWEIKGKDYDPEEPDRAASPYMYLVTDLISLAFTAAAGATTKVGLKQGIKKAPSATVNMLKAILEKMPWIKSTIKSFGDLIIKYIPKAKSVINAVFGFIDNILINVEKFISQLFSKRGATAAVAGVATAWMVNQRELSLGSSGQDVAVLNKFFLNTWLWWV